MRTLNENIADVTAFEVAYETLFSLPEMHKDNMELIDRKREFFLIYAQTWCERLDRKAEREFIRTRTHSIGWMRVNKVISQNSDFKQVWQCTNPQTSQMLRERQCSIFKHP